jgi:PhnB protein
MTATPVLHLNFSGRAREALEFYACAFGGTSAVRTYGEFGMPADLPDAGRVVWGEVVAAGGFHVMAYDIPSVGAPTEPAAPFTQRENGVTITNQPFFAALRSGTLDEAQQVWDALAPGASVVEPLAASAWSPGFGMLTDRFGVTWVIDVA